VQWQGSWNLYDESDVEEAFEEIDSRIWIRARYGTGTLAQNKEKTLL
jgi:hypothetical protein